MTYIIGDTHGSLKTLKALIKKLPTKEQIIFTGDLIDRGPSSKQVVQFVIDNNYPCVLGNHESFMCDDDYSFDDWSRNGGLTTLDSYGIRYIKRFSSSYLDPNQNTSTLKYKKFLEHKEWMAKLPLFLLFDDVVNDKGEKLLVTHSSAEKVWGWSEERKMEQSYHFKDTLIWGRNYNPKPIPEIFNVFGHTPMEKPIIKDGFAFIDTGAVFKNKLTALRFPEMELFQQDFID